jgi:hypothetical protein
VFAGFTDCGIKAVTLPNSVVEIKGHTFMDCPSLGLIDFGNCPALSDVIARTILRAAPRCDFDTIIKVFGVDIDPSQGFSFFDMEGRVLPPLGGFRFCARMRLRKVFLAMDEAALRLLREPLGFLD